MDELDDPLHMPEDLNPLVWKRFCQYRRSKVESEQQARAQSFKDGSED